MTPDGRHRDRRLDLPGIFDEMAQSAAALDGAIYAALCAAVADDLRAGGPTAVVLADLADARIGDMVPLRLLAAVHRLVLQRQLPALATFYPDVGGAAPRPGPAGDEARRAMATLFIGAVREHADEVRAGLVGVPQTNETGRSAALAGVLRLVEQEWGQPVDLHELGASAGLNLRADAYRLEPAGIGPVDARLVVEDCWDAADPRAPAPGPVRVATRTGCDLAPIDPTTEQGRLTLTSYVWPDHPRRYERLRAALATARQVPATLVRQPADDHVRGLRLRDGHVLVVWHSAMWMYPTAPERQRILDGLAALADRAAATRPLVHVAFEPLGADPADPHRFWLVVTSWPGLGGREAGVPFAIADAPAHGVPLRWREPSAARLA